MIITIETGDMLEMKMRAKHEAARDALIKDGILRAKLNIRDFIRIEIHSQMENFYYSNDENMDDEDAEAFEKAIKTLSETCMKRLSDLL